MLSMPMGDTSIQCFLDVNSPRCSHLPFRDSSTTLGASLVEKLCALDMLDACKSPLAFDDTIRGCFDLPEPILQSNGLRKLPVSYNVARHLQ